MCTSKNNECPINIDKCIDCPRWREPKNDEERGIGGLVALWKSGFFEH